MKKFALVAVLVARAVSCGAGVYAGDDSARPCPAISGETPVVMVVGGVEQAPDFIDLACQTLKTLGDEHRQLTAAVKRLNDDATNVDVKLQKLYADAGSITADLALLHAGVSKNCYPFCVGDRRIANRGAAERLTSTLLARVKAIQGSIVLLEAQLSAGHHETAQMVGGIDTLESRMTLVPFQTSRIAAKNLPQQSTAMLVTLEAMLPTATPEIQELQVRVAEFLAMPEPETATAEQLSPSPSVVK